MENPRPEACPLMRPSNALLLLATALLLAGCGREPAAPVIEQQFHLFGTIVSLTTYGLDEAQAQVAGLAVEQMFQRMHDDWHAWQKGALGEINEAIAAGRPIKVPPGLLPLIQRSQEASRRSDGLFNPAIGRLVRLWGFHASEMPNGPIPDPAEIAALVAAHPSMDDIEIRDGVLSCRNPVVRMDFGGIAKGYAVELALQRLRELGVANAIVNAGGGLGVIGRRGDRPWRIGIRHPLGAGVLGSLEVRDGEQVHTSGNYERFREWEGKRYSHIIDPRTGWPVQEVVSVTLIHRDGALADAFTKPFMVGGTREWESFAARLGVELVMLVDREGVVHMTPAMADRVQFETPPARTLISGP
jgi:FAD:protein FMN transferase